MIRQQRNRKVILTKVGRGADTVRFRLGKTPLGQSSIPTSIRAVTTRRLQPVKEADAVVGRDAGIAVHRNSHD